MSLFGIHGRHDRSHSQRFRSIKSISIFTNPHWEHIGAIIARGISFYATLHRHTAHNVVCHMFTWGSGVNVNMPYSKERSLRDGLRGGGSITAMVTLQWQGPPLPWKWFRGYWHHFREFTGTVSEFCQFPWCLYGRETGTNFTRCYIPICI